MKWDAARVRSLPSVPSLHLRVARGVKDCCDAATHRRSRMPQLSGHPLLCPVRSEATTGSAVNVGAAQPSRRQSSCYVFNRRANPSNLGRSRACLSTLCSCTAPGSLDKRLAYAARLKGWSCQAARASSGLRWPFFSISHPAL